MRASAHRINIFFVCKRFFMTVNHFINKVSIWIRKIFDLRFNMKDKTSCHIRVFTSFWSFRYAIEINFNNKLFDRVWLRLRSRLKLSIVKYTSQTARSFWCWNNIVLSEVIKNETMIVFFENLFLRFSSSIFDMHLRVYSLIIVVELTNEYVRQISNERLMTQKKIYFFEHVTILHFYSRVELVFHLEIYCNILFQSLFLVLVNIRWYFI
jgi:hypothetical protein